MFVLGSLTEPLVRLATDLIASLGLAGVALLTMTSGVIGVPGSEPTMLFAGFDVFRGNLSLPGIIAAGVVGDMAGASIAYSIGYFGSRELLEHQGKLHVRQSQLDRAHRWFDRYGPPVIFVSRLLPFVRAAFPYAAGVAKMPFGRFFALGTLGSLVWIGGLGILGRAVGSNPASSANPSHRRRWKHRTAAPKTNANGNSVISENENKKNSGPPRVNNRAKKPCRSPALIAIARDTNAHPIATPILHIRTPRRPPKYAGTAYKPVHNGLPHTSTQFSGSANTYLAKRK
jgi:membrane protein DedA with SNARE-associated domain